MGLASPISGKWRRCLQIFSQSGKVIFPTLGKLRQCLQIFSQSGKDGYHMGLACPILAERCQCLCMRCKNGNSVSRKGVTFPFWECPCACRLGPRMGTALSQIRSVCACSRDEYALLCQTATRSDTLIPKWEQSIGAAAACTGARCSKWDRRFPYGTLNSRFGQMNLLPQNGKMAPMSTNIFQKRDR